MESDSHSEHTCTAYLQYVFSCVEPAEFGWKTDNHSIHTYKAFLQFEFSCV